MSFWIQSRKLFIKNVLLTLLCLASTKWSCAYGLNSEVWISEYYKDPKKGKNKEKTIGSFVSSGYRVSVESSMSGCDYSKLDIASSSEIY